ncbi:probable leucine-rich repeat receptor-like serine/threonine-protein kinase At3g14840 isoform X2 [Humulus lupulus]|uniref:probable leucine-rich repeat receptor-like serine/threonine-protein kinase At3g14840 isoform X2 n=1 Tax=Humulus lupulus TaxID=3486 RepID=UPI002B405205|nr:probable leucine-rich repeat receptor-like serine/threonine-protein kinase At3g14840 isoform X2 [Humulus lupulus]
MYLQSHFLSCVAISYMLNNMASSQSQCVTVLSLFILFFFLSPVIQWKAQAGVTLPTAEVEAIKEIAAQMNKTDWNFDDPCSNQSTIDKPRTDQYINEIVCNCFIPAHNECHIQSFNFSGQDLDGNLPPSLWKLPYLKEIKLEQNILKGPIPREWTLTKLESVHISANNLSGPIPAYIGNITTLTYLSLESNLFSGTVPSELGKLVNLTHLNLNANNLTGQFPLSLTNLSKLSVLRISSNNFTGSMPEFSGWKQLQNLEMEASGFKGPIPSSISSLDKLIEIRITDLNGESSNIPDLRNMTNMRKVMMRSCNLRGNIPEYFRNFETLNVLDLSFNKLTGGVQNLEHLIRLKTLYLTSNLLSGPIPKWIISRGATFKLERNILKGPIPREWTLTKLESVHISANNLSGPIPAYIGNITTLTYLSLESNLFSGTVPSELGKLVNLTHLNLNANNLTGQFPLALTNLSKLSVLRISSNNFTGSMPEFSGWKQLQRLEMEASGFKGPIPSSISSLDKLIEIRITDLNGESSNISDLRNMTNIKKVMMRSCNLRGNIPEYFRNFETLNVLDLSFNKLTGGVQNLEHLIRLKTLYLTSNLLSGPIPKWIISRGATFQIDLSYNYFSEISELSTCKDSYLNQFRSTCGHENNSMLSQCLSPCSKEHYSLHINCGGKQTTIGNIKYEEDQGSVHPSIFFKSSTNWGFSNTGDSWDSITKAGDYIANNASVLRMNNSELYTTARISPLSLTYYARCLGNGNYTVKLHFAEIVIRDNKSYYSLGRRIFDVYVQGKLELKDFNIEKEAKGVDKEFIKVVKGVVVSHKTLEIRLQWTGKGTRNIRKRGSYGSLISAISINSDFEPPRTNKTKKFIIIGLASFLCLLCMAYLCILGWKGYLGTATNNDLIWTSTNLKRGDNQPELHFFGLDNILMATNKFSITNKLGQGGFGPVYKGQLHGKEVAVKRLSSSSSQGDEEFRNEMILISKLQHRNLVKLIGCCIENEEKLLIYEFMLNKSLDTFIFDDRRRVELDWAIRFNIIDGIARGLVYLHRDSSSRVIHRDLKASNILLDEKMTPKISDFGLARIFEGTLDLANTHRVVGTIGYMSPEYALRGIFSEKSDVFSYGVLLLEIISGKKNTSFKEEDQYQGLIAYSWQLWSEGRGIELVDEALGKSYNESEALKCIHIGLLCVQDFATDRPSMAQVASMLSNQIFDQPQPKQPIFTFQAGSSSSYDPSTQSGSRCAATVSVVEPR